MKYLMAEYAQKIIQSLLFTAFGIYLLLAFITYSPYDPGWTRLASDTQEVSNFCGASGAWIVDLLKGFLGIPSVLIAVYLLLEAAYVWYPYGKLSHVMRWIAQIFCLVGCSALFSLYALNTHESSTGWGGIIGYEIAGKLTPVLSPITSTIILCALLLILATLAFGLDWNQLLKDIRALFRTLYPTPQTTRDGSLAQPDYQLFNEKFAQNMKNSALSAQVAGRSINLPDDYLFSQQLGRVLNAHDSVDSSSVPSSEKTFSFFPVADAHDSHLQEEDHYSLAELRREDKQVLASKPMDDPKKNVSEDNDRHLMSLSRKDMLESSFGSEYLSQEAVTPPDVVTTADKTDLLIEPKHQSVMSPNEQTDWDLDALDKALLFTPVAVWPSSEISVNQAQQGSQEEIYHSSPLSYEPFNGKDIDNQLANQQVEDAFDTNADDSWSRSDVPSPANEVSKVIVPDQLAHDFNDELDGDKLSIIPESTAQSGDSFYSHAFATAEKRKSLSPLPGLDLLDLTDPNSKQSFSPEELQRLSKLLEIKLQEFNIKANVIEAQPGPVVTRFEIELAPGVKASKVTGISRDLARSMSMPSVRVVEVIPGKPYIGIEVPNHKREMVRLIELLNSDTYRDPKAALSMAMGKDIAGKAVITDMAKTPHMLVAGTTGSGKSVAVNAMLLSLLLKYQPDHLRLILIDPKQLELANYSDIPHLLTPVVTDMKDAISALTWCVAEMERRYKLMSIFKVRKIDEFNRKIIEANERGEEVYDPLWRPGDTALAEKAPRLKPLPFIVIVADEFADLIMQVGKKAEELITRLAQKARAAGIHLLLATQRPSVDVITGLIKANIPTRVALRVNSKIDSRTILDAGGAEDMLGHGDMLFLAPGKNEAERVHGAFISDDEVNRICEAWRERGSPDYVDDILNAYDEEGGKGVSADGESSDTERDPMYDQVVSFVLETRKVSASMIQRKFSLGYNRAARIVDQMEASGIISEMSASGKREILV